MLHFYIQDQRADVPCQTFSPPEALWLANAHFAKVQSYFFMIYLKQWCPPWSFPNNSNDNRWCHLILIYLVTLILTSYFSGALLSPSILSVSWICHQSPQPNSSNSSHRNLKVLGDGLVSLFLSHTCLHLSFESPETTLGFASSAPCFDMVYTMSPPSTVMTCNSLNTPTDTFEDSCDAN